MWQNLISMAQRAYRSNRPFFCANWNRNYLIFSANELSVFRKIDCNIGPKCADPSPFELLFTTKKNNVKLLSRRLGAYRNFTSPTSIIKNTCGLYKYFSLTKNRKQSFTLHTTEIVRFLVQ